MLLESRASIGGKPLRLKVLTSKKDRMRGYQFAHRSPSDSEGMMFVFPSESKQSFHMHNVKFNLDLLVFDKNGILRAIIPMEANRRKPYTTPTTCMYCVEVPGQWGSQLKVGVNRLRLHS